LGCNARNFAVLDALAETIGDAAVGPSRPVVDAGWAPFGLMIGQTGKDRDARGLCTCGHRAGRFGTSSRLGRKAHHRDQQT
jgi:hypothetical protein